MKKLSICLTVILIFSIFSTLSVFGAHDVKVSGYSGFYNKEVKDVKIYVNGKEYKGKYCFHNDRTMVDVWDFCQNYLLGEKNNDHNWFAVWTDISIHDRMIVQRESDGRKIVFFKGANKMQDPNDEIIDIDCTSFVYNQTNYVPLRYLCESFGYSVNWDGKTRTITVE